MSHYKQQEYDFIERTKKILEQYDSIELHANDKYEVTLLLNCMVGLLILPQQNWFDLLPSDLISVKDWGIGMAHISNIKSGESKTVKDVARHLRNSIAHYRFTAFDNSSKKISRIQFFDYDISEI